jgi:hypothetical protein
LMTSRGVVSNAASEPLVAPAMRVIKGDNLWGKGGVGGDGAGSVSRCDERTASARKRMGGWGVRG